MRNKQRPNIYRDLGKKILTEETRGYSPSKVDKSELKGREVKIFGLENNRLFCYLNAVL